MTAPAPFAPPLRHLTGWQLHELVAGDDAMAGVLARAELARRGNPVQDVLFVFTDARRAR